MKVYLIAGESSGDYLGSELMSGLRKLYSDICFFGVGGPLMEGKGLSSLFPMNELSLMGLFEIIPKLPSLIKRKNEVINNVLSIKPDILITIDSPDFTLRVAKGVKRKTNIKIIHYVAPTVWAWRKGRARRMTKYIDHVLALFPFEPKILKKSGLKSHFVGHPITSSLIATGNEVSTFREKYNIKNKRLLLVLPGSRHSEVKKLIGTFEKSLLLVNEQFPNHELIIPITKNVEGYVRNSTASWAKKPVIISSSNESEKRAAFYEAEVALAASGTVSLELAFNSVPMVIAYDLNIFSRIIMNYLLKIESVCLVNIVSGSKVIPEFLGKECRPEKIANALISLISDENLRNTQKEVQESCIKALEPQFKNSENYLPAHKVFEIIANKI